MSFLSDDDGTLNPNGPRTPPPISHFAPLIPIVLTTADACRSRGDEDTLQVINDVVYDLVNSPLEEVTVFIPQVVAYCALVINDGNLDLTTRDGASLVVSTVAECKPKLFGRKCNVEGIVESMMCIIEVSEESAAGAFFENNPAWKEDAEEGEEDDEDEN